ncbi:hypothetical protein ACFW9L_26900 [Streptomyces sp. NPDC059517]|uniref:hypothetical protein n=1 Tax=Streptomyces sp. NPDC059517 TaxID=3346855 RepID=UPI0036A30938
MSRTLGLKQVSRRLTDPDRRAGAPTRATGQIGEDAWVVVARSLGSAVAYETPCARPGHQVRGPVTIGSPPGMCKLPGRRAHRPAPHGCVQEVTVAPASQEEVTLATGIEALPPIIQGWRKYFAARYMLDA